MKGVKFTNIFNTFIFIAIIIVSCNFNLSANELCYHDIYKNDSVSVLLFERETCNYSIFDGNGFIITEQQISGFTHILWGEASIDADQTDFLLYDFDKDGINELLTLYSSCTSICGYVHKLSISKNSEISISSTKIPDSVCSQIDYNGSLEVRDNEFLINGIDPDYTSYISISYDDMTQSFSFRYIINK